MKIEDNKNPNSHEINYIVNLFKSGDFIKAEKEIKVLLLRFKNSSILHNILGSIEVRKKNYNKSLIYFEKSIELDPNYAQAYNSLGIVYQKLNNFEESLKNYAKAISLNDNFSEAYNNKGNLLLKFDQIDNAIKNFRKAIEIFNNYAEAYNGLGAAYEKAGLYDNALINYKKSLQINSNYGEVYFNIGNLFVKEKKFEEAMINFEKSIKLNPKFEKVYNNLGNLLSNLGNFEKAHDAYNSAISLKKNYSVAYSNLLFNLVFRPDFKINNYLHYAHEFRKNCTNKISHNKINYKFKDRPEKIKLGFVSSDFGMHPGGFFTLNLLEELSKKNYELFAYVPLERKDDLSVKFKKLFVKWNLIENKKDEDVVKNILDDGINILIDAQGHSRNNRLTLFIDKPAPVQISWLGQGSTGIPEIDYFVGSKHITPEDEDHHYTEKIYRLPKISQCFFKPNVELNINELPALKNKFVTFGSLNQISKVNDDVIALWSKILISIPNSKLLLKNKYLESSYVLKNIIKIFEKNNIYKESLILEGESQNREEFLSTYHKIDICLDPFPFQGNTTSLESLWMGVPVLTLKGDRYIFHFGESINSNIDLIDWIAKNKNDYINKAKHFSSNLAILSKLRNTLRNRMLKSPIFDYSGFVNDFDLMLNWMWNNYLKNK